jgi:hypothetical protein
VERVKGIEPSSQAWEAYILPLNHTRVPGREVVATLPSARNRSLCPSVQLKCLGPAARANLPHSRPFFGLPKSAEFCGATMRADHSLQGPSTAASPKGDKTLTFSFTVSSCRSRNFARVPENVSLTVPSSAARTRLVMFNRWRTVLLWLDPGQFDQPVGEAGLLSVRRAHASGPTSN